MQKQKVQQIVEDMPEDVDIDVLMERLYLLRKIDIAEKQIAAGQGIPHDEAKKRLEKWLK